MKAFFTFEALISLAVAIALISQISFNSNLNYNDLRMLRTADNVIDVLLKNTETFELIKKTTNSDAIAAEQLEKKLQAINSAFPSQCFILKLSEMELKGSDRCNSGSRLEATAKRTIFHNGQFYQATLKVTLTA